MNGFLQEWDLLPEDVIYFMTKKEGLMTSPTTPARSNGSYRERTGGQQWDPVALCGTPQKQNKTFNDESLIFQNKLPRMGVILL